jgi:hypothetical protein
MTSEDRLAQAVVEGRATSFAAMRRVVKRMKEGRKDAWNLWKHERVL